MFSEKTDVPPPGFQFFHCSDLESYDKGDQNLIVGGGEWGEGGGGGFPPLGFQFFHCSDLESYDKGDQNLKGGGGGGGKRKHNMVAFDKSGREKYFSFFLYVVDVH